MTAAAAVNPESVRAGLDLRVAVRSLDRAGDYCCNIAEYVACLVRRQHLRQQRFGEATPA